MWGCLPVETTRRHIDDGSQAAAGRNKNSIKTEVTWGRGCNLVLGRDFLWAPWTTLWKLCAKNSPLNALRLPALTTPLPERWAQGGWEGGWGCPWALRFRPAFSNSFALHCFKVHAEGGWNGEGGGPMSLPRRLESIPRHLHIAGRQGKAAAGQPLALCCGERIGKRS